MKRLYLELLGVAASLLGLFYLSDAQPWGPEIQVTSSNADDRNVSASFYNNEIWLFWDREVVGGRQVFCRRLDVDGQPVGEEIQLTTGPGHNYAPRAPCSAYSWSYGDSLLAVCWEHMDGQDKDVQFTYYNGEIWHPATMAFGTEEDEYSPWLAEGFHSVAYHMIKDITLVAQKDSAIMLQRYDFDQGQLLLMEQLTWEFPVGASHPSCGRETESGDEDLLSCVWQVSSSSDTSIYRKRYDFDNGWGNLEIVNTSGMDAFEPFTNNSEIVWFSHIQNGLTRIGAYRDYVPFPWSKFSPQGFGPFQGNQLEAFTLSSGAGIFVSDSPGNFEVFFVPWDEAIQLSSSPFDDRNPAAAVLFSWGSWYRYAAFWESNRNGNWDIFQSLSGYYSPVIPGGTREVIAPECFRVSVHPNPGNAEFRIDLELPVRGEVEAAIYDLSGRRMAKIHDGVLPAGSKTLSWDASEITSGIYLLKVVCADKIQTRKMVVLK